MKQNSLKSLILILSLFALHCCEDSPPCGQAAVSSISFNYSGTQSGVYFAKGEVPSSDTTAIYNHQWAMAGLFSDFGEKWILLQSNLPQGIEIEGIQMHVPAAGVGKFKLPSDRGLDFIIATSGSGLDFISGEIEITYYQCGRVIGTFQGMLGNPSGTISMAMFQGAFDLKLKNL